MTNAVPWPTHTTVKLPKGLDSMKKVPPGVGGEESLNLMEKSTDSYSLLKKHHHPTWIFIYIY